MRRVSSNGPIYGLRSRLAGGVTKGHVQPAEAAAFSGLEGTGMQGVGYEVKRVSVDWPLLCGAAGCTVWITRETCVLPFTQYM